MDQLTIYAGPDPVGITRFLDALDHDRRQARNGLPSILEQIRERYETIIAECHWLERAARSGRATFPMLTKRPRRSRDVKVPQFKHDRSESEILRYQSAYEALNTMIGLAAELEAIRMGLLDARYWHESQNGDFVWIGNRPLVEIVEEALAAMRQWAGSYLPDIRLT